jgi:hypothetical protein
LAKINSEIKYVANSIVRDSPTYAYPQIKDIRDWQSSISSELDRWYDRIPNTTDTDGYIRLVCQLRYHNIRMLLHRPSPAIPLPSPESTRKCFESSLQEIRIHDQLYQQNLLVYSWETFHSLLLGTISMLYCIFCNADIARDIGPNDFSNYMKMSLGILSAIGEHWSGAKRSRKMLDELSAAALLRINQPSHTSGRAPRQQHPRRSVSTHIVTDGNQSIHDGAAENLEASRGLDGISSTCFNALNPTGDVLSTLVSGTLDTTSQLPEDLFLGAGSFFEFQDSADSTNLDSIMSNLFDDFIQPLGVSNFYNANA